MLDYRSWLGLGDDEDDDPVKKALGMLGQGATAAGQAVQDVGSGISSAVQPYLPQPSATPAPEDYSTQAITSPYGPEPAPAAPETGWSVQSALAPADQAYGSAFEQVNREEDEAARRNREVISNPLLQTAIAPVEAARRAARLGTAAIEATPEAIRETANTASGQVGLGREDVGVDLPLVGRTGITDVALALNPSERLQAVMGAGQYLPAYGRAGGSDVIERAGRAALEAGRGALGRAGEAIAGNAERVAAADARMAAEGSTLAPGTLGAVPEEYGRPYPPIRGDVRGVVREQLGEPSAEMLADSRYPRDAVHPDLRAAGIGPEITPQIDLSSRLNAGFGTVPEGSADRLRTRYAYRDPRDPKQGLVRTGEERVVGAVVDAEREARIRNADHLGALRERQVVEARLARAPDDGELQRDLMNAITREEEAKSVADAAREWVQMVKTGDRTLATAGTLPEAAGPDRLAGVNRVLGQGLASSVSGGVGAQINQEMNPDDPYAGLKGFAAGALVPPLAARGGMAAARRASRSTELGSAARIGLGDVPPSQIRRPMLPGMEPPAPAPIGEAAEAVRLEQFPGVQSALSRSERRAAAMAQRGEQPLGPLQWLGKAFGTATYSSLLGPATATMNIATGLAEPLWKLPRDVVGAAGRSVQRGDVQPFRELNQAHAGALYGLSQVGGEILDALRASGRYASHPERPNLSAQTINPGLHLVASALETPGRVAGAVPDAIFGTVSRYQGQGEAAARIATDLGLTGQAWEQKVAQLRADAKAVTKSKELPTSTEVQQVVDAGEALAQRTTLTDPLGTIGQKAKSKAQLGGGPLGIWASPFFNSPWNALLRTAEKTPAGWAMNTQSSNTYAKHYDAVVGTAVGLGMLKYASSGGVTGSGPEDPRQRELLALDGWQPYSTYVKLPGQETGHYVPNRVFGPFEPILNAVGEGHDMLAYQKEDADDRAKMMDGLRRGGKLIRQNPYLFSGLVSILDAAEGGVPAFAAENLARITPFAATTRSLGMSGDPSERTTDRGAGVPLPTEIGQRWQQSVGRRGGLPEAQDPFGRVRANPRTGAAAFGPKITTEKKDAAAGIFRAAGVGIGDPPTEIRIGKSQNTPPMPITPAERRAWDTARGEVLVEAAAELAADPDWASAPKEAQQKALRKIMDQAAKAANGSVLETIDDAEIDRRIEKELAKKAG